jgi:hypothetical protein
MYTDVIDLILGLIVGITISQCIRDLGIGLKIFATLVLVLASDAAS